MSIVPQIFADPATLGRAAAERVADGIQAARGQGRSFLLGCPGGRSAMSTYRALAEIVADRGLDLSHVIIVMMDDYLVDTPSGGLRHEDDAADHSCIRFGREQIQQRLSAAARPGHGLPEEALWLPDPGDPQAYDRRISDAGGVDVFLLASGASDGHVAFNPPGAARESRSRIVVLPDSTRRDNLATFPSFGQSLDRVPRHGITVGVDTIAAQSAAVIMLLHGTDKAEATRRLTIADSYDPSWPATILTECADPLLFADRAAIDSAAPISAV